MIDNETQLHHCRLEIKNTFGLTDSTFRNHFEDIAFGDDVIYDGQFHDRAQFLGIEYVNGEACAWLMVKEERGFVSYPKNAEKVMKK